MIILIIVLWLIATIASGFVKGHKHDGRGIHTPPAWWSKEAKAAWIAAGPKNRFPRYF